MSAAVVEVDDGFLHGAFAAVSGPRMHGTHGAAADAHLRPRICMLLPVPALNVSVVGGQVTLNIQRLHARAGARSASDMYGTFAHTLSLSRMAYEGHTHRIL